MTPRRGKRTCITCGETFTIGERRYGDRCYDGEYCEDHDSRTSEP